MNRGKIVDMVGAGSLRSGSMRLQRMQSWLMRTVNGMSGPASHRLIHGSCHCGNVRFTLQWPDARAPIPVRACGCTLCTKHRGVWTSHPNGRFALQIGDPSGVRLYRFGTRTADFHVCTTCGVVPIVTCTIDGVRYAVVNVNTFDDVDRSELIESRADFEGETTQSRLERRRRHWTPEAPADEPPG